MFQSELHIYAQTQIGILRPYTRIEGQSLTDDIIDYRTNKQYHISNHLGNVLTTITDRRHGVDDDMDDIADYYTSEITQAQDYYPFGMMMSDANPITPSNEISGRTYHNTLYQSSSYRFAYNGKEIDGDMHEEVSQYDYQFRNYNPGLGRFLSVDPLAHEFSQQSPYLYAYNNPINFIDVDGLYGGKKEAENQRKNAKESGLNVGEVYKSGKEWAFQVVNGDDSYSAFDKEFENSKNESVGLRMSQVALMIKGMGELSNSLGELHSSILYQDGFRQGTQGNYKLSGRNYSLFSKDKMTAWTKPFSAFTKWGNRVSNVGTGFAVGSVVADGVKWWQGDLHGGRYAYRSSGVGLSIWTATSFTGPLGLTVGAIFAGGEFAYDSAAKPAYDDAKSKLNIFIWRMKNWGKNVPY